MRWRGYARTTRNRWIAEKLSSPTTVLGKDGVRRRVLGAQGQARHGWHVSLQGRKGPFPFLARALLALLIPQFEAGKLRFRRSSPRSREPNRWEIIET
jgi:hypothetical protein